MPTYRIYSITAGDRIEGPPKIIERDSDSAAVEQAKQLIDSKTVEVWEGARRVTRMGQILKFIPADTYFDPETVAILGTAFDRTIAALRDGRQPDAVRQAIAERIIALASKGERNPDRLCEATLAAMGVLR
jgi:hypothetical protein